MPAAEPIPVLLVNTPTAPPLGADSWIHALVIRALDRRRIDVHVACTPTHAGAPTPFYEAFRDVPDTKVLPVHFGTEWSGGRETRRERLARRLSDVRLVPSLAKAAWYVRRHRIEVIHTVSRPRDAVASVLLGRATRTPCLIHMHVGYGDWMSAPLRWALRHADGLVAISEFVKSTLTGNGIPEDRIHLAHNAIELEKWQPAPRARRRELRAELGLPPDGPLVVSVSRLFPAKGTAELLRATALVRATVPDVHVVVVGRDTTGGGYLELLHRIVDELGLGDAVTFAGQRSDVVRFMGAADVFAMPSEFEPFGLVYAEAMAMAIPVVSLANGGTPEVVAHAETGLLSESGDVDGLAENLRTILTDPELQDRMGASGRARVEAAFTVPHLASAMARIYAASS